ncbi:MAG: hypothetical protein E5V74_01730 [Mesorhizobium sp.]|nr:MAG: hypothetical protein E5V74_01730 [Mesorhizobium sp.]
MGCDIYIVAERKTADGYKAIRDVQFTEGTAPFDWRSYGLFGFLADVRNYSQVPPIAQPRGLPDDASPEARDDAELNITHSWLSVSELKAFDYDRLVEDRRLNGQPWDGRSVTTEPGFGEMVTYRAFLGEAFFRDLEKLVECGADRIVFCFDS